MTLGEFSLFLGMIGAIPYIFQIVRGGVRPERATWFVWTLILALALWSYRSSGATDSSLFLANFTIALVVAVGKYQIQHMPTERVHSS